MAEQGLGGVLALPGAHVTRGPGGRERRDSGSSYGRGSVYSVATSGISDDDRSSIAGTEADTASVAGSSASRGRRHRKRGRRREAVPDPFKAWSALWSDQAVVVCFVVASSVVTAIEFRAEQRGL